MAIDNPIDALKKLHPDEEENLPKDLAVLAGWRRPFFSGLRAVRRISRIADPRVCASRRVPDDLAVLAEESHSFKRPSSVSIARIFPAASCNEKMGPLAVTVS